MIGKAIVTCIESVEYTNKKNEEKKGFIVHCIKPCLTEEKDALLSELKDPVEYVELWLNDVQVSRCWVSIDSLSTKKMQGLEVGCDVMIRAGKYGEYIDYVL